MKWNGGVRFILVGVIFFPIISNNATANPVSGTIPASGAVLLSDVPAYTTSYATAPAVGLMFLGYYALHGYPQLIPADPREQSSSINDLMISPDHLRDYASPVDSLGNLQADGSVLDPPPHPDDCMADLMYTSRYIVNNPYGYTHLGDFSDGIGRYASWQNLELPAEINDLTVLGQAAITSGTFAIIRSEIDARRPLIGVYAVTRQTDLNFGFNDWLLIVGYDPTPHPSLVAVLNPKLDKNVHWLPFTPWEDGVLSWVYLEYSATPN